MFIYSLFLCPWKVAKTCVRFAFIYIPPFMADWWLWWMWWWCAPLRWWNELTSLLRLMRGGEMVRPSLVCDSVSSVSPPCDDGDIELPLMRSPFLRGCCCDGCLCSLRGEDVGARPASSEAAASKFESLRRDGWFCCCCCCCCCLGVLLYERLGCGGVMPLLLGDGFPLVLCEEELLLLLLLLLKLRPELMRLSTDWSSWA